MSMLGPFASYNKRTGYATWDHPTAEYVGIFERINVGIKGIIHVGLWDLAEKDCYTKLVGTKVVGVEANPQVFEQMSKPVADERGYTIFNECLCDVDGAEMEFYLAGHGSSLHRGPAQWGKNESITVKTKTLATMMDENELDPTEYDFLNIDAEGSELDILKGYERYLENVNVIDLETSIDDRHLSGCSHNAIVEWLGQRGFKLREASSDSYQREGWGDAVFVRFDKELPEYTD